MKIALSTPGGYDFESVKGMPSGGQSTLNSVLKWGTTVLLITAIILTLFFLIWGGIEWTTSGGDKEKLAKAQKKIVFAAIGLIITLSAFMIVNITGNLLGISFW